jgi:lysophospholipid acyltransferase (LPLAT)-like uncharacterized protein
VTSAPVESEVGAPAWQRSWKKRAEIAAIAGVGTPLLKALAGTVTWETVGREHLDGIERARTPHIFALWHGRILPCMWYFRDRGIVVVTSENFDGEWIARIIQRFGFGAARGSSSRGGARALRSLLKTIADRPAGFTVDGPRGPRGIAQPGVVWLARATGHPVIPIHAEAARHWTLRSWDRTQVPKPWTRLVMAIESPIVVARDADADGLERARLEVEAALRAAEARARQACGLDAAGG